MIAPEGYVPLITLHNRLYSEFSESHNEFCRFYYSVPIRFLIRFPDDFYNQMLFDFVGDNLFASDGFSNPVRVDQWSFRQNRFLFNMMSAGEAVCLEQIPSEMQKRYGFGSYLNMSEFDGLADTAIKDFIEDKLHDALGCVQPYMFLETQLFSIDSSLYQQLLTLDSGMSWSMDSQDGIKRVASALNRIEGYFTCTPAEYVEQNFKSFCTQYFENLRKTYEGAGDKFSSSSEGLDYAKGGRPAIGPELLKIYHRLYPNGKSGVSWKVVQRQVSIAYGEEFHIDTLKRQLGLKG